MSEKTNPAEEPLNGGSSHGENEFVEDPGYEAPVENESFEDADVETSLSDADLSFLDEAQNDLAAERLADLQRVSAEYANYRKRVDRDREAMNDLAAAAVVSELLPILDDLGRAKDHGEYDGALKSVGDQLEATTAKLGLEAFGAEGDAFDPMIHEAMTHEGDKDLDQPTVATVFQVGYRFRGRVLRPARVGVEE